MSLVLSREGPQSIEYASSNLGGPSSAKQISVNHRVQNGPAIVLCSGSLKREPYMGFI